MANTIAHTHLPYARTCNRSLTQPAEWTLFPGFGGVAELHRLLQAGGGPPSRQRPRQRSPLNCPHLLWPSSLHSCLHTHTPHTLTQTEKVAPTRTQSSVLAYFGGERFEGTEAREYRHLLSLTSPPLTDISRDPKAQAGYGDEDAVGPASREIVRHSREPCSIEEQRWPEGYLTHYLNERASKRERAKAVGKAGGSDLTRQQWRPMGASTEWVCEFRREFQRANSIEKIEKKRGNEESKKYDKTLMGEFIKKNGINKEVTVKVERLK